MANRTLATFSLLLATGSLVQAEGPFLFRNPALSATQIVFTFAGDLWSVGREGGDARRLTTGTGVETGARFSPDGMQMAFTGEYDGNVDVFVMPAAGGVPRRLTFHPKQDTAEGWTPDGKRVLFSSSRTTANDGVTLFTVAVEGGFPEELPLPIAMDGSYSPDGSHIAYAPVFQWQDAWKRYRGGQTKKIWMADLKDSSVVEIPRNNSNDFNAMWAGGFIYFLSDRDGAVTLYSYDTRTRQVKRVVDNAGFDLKSASLGPGAIAYEQFGSLHLYDLKTGKTRPVTVRLAGDMPEVRPRFVNAGKRLSNASLSPNGARAVFEARGEIVTVPAEKGEARNLTGTTGAFERDPAWSPDGKTIAYFSEESGEYELHVREQSGMGEARKFKLGEKPAFYTAPRWSPDSKKVAYLDNHLGIWYIDLESQKVTLVDTDYYVTDRERAPAWSPDSKWLAYSKQLKSHMGAIHLYSLESGKSTQVTDGMSDAGRPVFDKGGKYLYFLASTNSGPAMEPDVHAFSRVVTRGVYLMVLTAKQNSPLAPESDDEKPAVDGKDDKKKDEKKDEAAAKVEVQVDFDNIGQRILAVPIPVRSYSELFVGKAGVVYVVEDPPRPPEPESKPKLTVHRYDLGTRKADAPVSGVRSFQISANGEKMLLQKEDQWIIAAAPAESAVVDMTKGVLKTESMEVRVDPPVEWRQMYREVWRLERDFFYDPNAHGLDLKAAEKRYEPFLENIASRHDLSYLFTEMLGELSVGHLFLGGGDAPEPKKVEVGMLGADYKVENGRYRFANVIHGQNWNPELKAPLTQPGVNIAAGEYLLAVNGRELRGTDDIHGVLEGTAGKAVVLRVGSDPSGAGAREVTVTPVADEEKLRKLAWVEANRRKVDQMTGGRVAYIYMPDTGYGGYLSFSRYFFAQVGKEAAIIDDRFNHGGHLATDIVEYLKRPLMSMITTRDGADWAQPQGAIFGPKVMIINEFAGSGGDAMPWYFRRAGVGKLIGKRTWGGLVGMSGVPELMDGGMVTAPSAAIWNPNGQYDVENIGTAPDIEVEQDPKAVREGHDPQLEKAVTVVLQELARNPAPELKRPPYPNYHRKQN